MIATTIDTGTLFMLARTMRSSVVYDEIKRRGRWLDYCNDLIARDLPVPELREQNPSPA